ncbi:hypothetical protein BC343_27115 [Mucilaginibacter pedocola]|uniref:Uncharacterized protein n=1 Tax=Mucilaginibacter pedocola TaxID=1792845 RepID=A0A1S9PGB2_9SPHI|nr:hypothetical protein BC343_27115 [Mucilaginibacter pedocola]
MSSLHGKLWVCAVPPLSPFQSKQAAWRFRLLDSGDGGDASAGLPFPATSVSLGVGLKQIFVKD